MKLRDRVALPYHWLRGALSATLAGFPGKKLTVIGVTGTNGKTTTSFMIWKMLNESGRKAGLMSTVAWGVDELRDQEEHMTTVSRGQFNKRVGEIVKEGAEYLVLEMTSHALMQSRALGVPIKIAVMTNVTHEHLDYHGSLRNYIRAKIKMFRNAEVGIVNRDDPNYRKFCAASKRAVTYGVDDGMVRATGVKLGADGVEYEVLEGGEKVMKVRTRIPGVFNVYNSLAAVVVGRELGMSNAEIEKGIYALSSVNGRMERIDEGQNFEVIVDFAHTPDAMEKVYESVGKVKGRIITVFGGAGRRDIEGRKMRGEVAARRGDLLVITEDDSRDESVEEIMGQIAEGAIRGGMEEGKNMWKVADRRMAVRKAFEMAKRGDVVLLLGKGHEATILRGDAVVPYYDPKVAMEELRRLAKK